MGHHVSVHAMVFLGGFGLKIGVACLSCKAIYRCLWCKLPRDRRVVLTPQLLLLCLSMPVHSSVTFRAVTPTEATEATHRPARQLRFPSGLFLCVLTMQRTPLCTLRQWRRAPALAVQTVNRPCSVEVQAEVERELSPWPCMALKQPTASADTDPGPRRISRYTINCYN